MQITRFGWLVGYGPIVAAVVVITAGALAVAGYGFPVGVGLLAGAALGFGVGFIVAISMPPSRGVNALSRRRGRGWTAVVSATGVDKHEELLVNHKRAEVIEEGPLVAVAAGGAVAAGSDLTLDLIAVEFRRAGGIVHTAARLDQDRAIPGGLVRATVRDDAGTSYAAGGFQAGGSLTARYEIAFAPAPPSDARRLVVEIAEFANPFPIPPGMPPRSVDLRGLWRFEVALPPRAAE